MTDERIVGYGFTGNVEKDNIPRCVNKTEEKEGDEKFDMDISIKLIKQGWWELGLREQSTRF